MIFTEGHEGRTTGSRTMWKLVQVSHCTLIAWSLSLPTGCKQRTSTPTPDCQQDHSFTKEQLGLRWHDYYPSTCAESAYTPIRWRTYMNRNTAAYCIAPWSKVDHRPVMLQRVYWHPQTSKLEHGMETRPYLFKLSLDMSKKFCPWHLCSLILNFHHKRPAVT